MAKLNSHASIGTSINFVQQMFTFHAELTARIISRSSKRTKNSAIVCGYWIGTNRCCLIKQIDLFVFIFSEMLISFGLFDVNILFLRCSLETLNWETRNIELGYTKHWTGLYVYASMDLTHYHNFWLEQFMWGRKQLNDIQQLIARSTFTKKKPIGSQYNFQITHYVKSNT